MLSKGNSIYRSLTYPSMDYVHPKHCDSGIQTLLHLRLRLRGRHLFSPPQEKFLLSSDGLTPKAAQEGVLQSQGPCYHGNTAVRFHFPPLPIRSLRRLGKTPLLDLPVCPSAESNFTKEEEESKMSPKTALPNGAPASCVVAVGPGLGSTQAVDACCLLHPAPGRHRWCPWESTGQCVPGRRESRRPLLPLCLHTV